jgi:alpha-L-fucosidase
LQATYLASLGHNSNWLLDIAPPPNSTVVPSHMAGYVALGSWVSSCFGSPIASAPLPRGQLSLTLPLPGGSSGSAVDRVRLREDQSAGQLIRSYTVDIQRAAGGPFSPFSEGTSVGSGKVDVVATPVTAVALRVTVDSAPTGLVVDAFMCS